jgi:hypothetical protein
MNLVPKEILMSHLQRSEGAEEVTLPIDFFRDLLYQAMPRTWVGLTDEPPKRWAVFCGICRKEWSVPYQHSGKSVCDECVAAHGIKGEA